MQKALIAGLFFIVASACGSGSGGDGPDAPDAGDAGTLPSDAEVDADACAEQLEGPEECPCAVPKRGAACEPLNLTCIYDEVLTCVCKENGFRCSLPLPE